MSKKPKIVMVNPQASPKMPYDGPPLSILAAVCMIDLDRYDVRIIDWHYPDYEERIRRDCADAFVCGITAMTGYQISTMLEAAHWAQESNPKINIVVGANHATLMPEQTLEHPLINFVVRGQGHRTFNRLVEHLAQGDDCASVRGIGFKKNGQLVQTEEAPREDINNFPPTPITYSTSSPTFLSKPDSQSEPLMSSPAKVAQATAASAGKPLSISAVGVESGDNRTLKIMNKEAAVEDTIAVLPIARQYGIRIQCSYVVQLSPKVWHTKSLRACMASPDSWPVAAQTAGAIRLAT